MNNKEISRIIILLKKTYDGAAWHGASVMEILNNISAKQAFKPSKDIHRICELVQHNIAWRIFAVKRLDGDHHYEVSQRENWKAFTVQDDEAWKSIKSELAESQKRLINALEKHDDHILNEEVHGKAYDYYTLIHGVIHHDLYHLGEIALLAREFKE